MVYKGSFGEYTVVLTVEHYVDGGGFAVQLWSYDEEMEGYEPFSVLTVNLPGYSLEEDCCFIDTNNNPGAEDFIREYKMGTAEKYKGRSGLCSYPSYKMDMELLKQMDSEARRVLERTDAIA